VSRAEAIAVVMFEIIDRASFEVDLAVDWLKP
jgi:hypothetical protein